MFSYSFSFTPLNGGGNSSKTQALAFADLIIDDTLKITGFKIMETDGRKWVSPPQEKGKDKSTGEDRYYSRIWWEDAKDSDDAKQTKAQAEVYSEMISAFESGAASDNRQSAASAQSDRNSGNGDADSGGGRSRRVWGRKG